MIKIIKGVYGFVNSDGAVQPKTIKDAPFTLDAEKEARLVAQGVAEYVESVEADEFVPEPAPEPEPEKKPAKRKSRKKSARKKEPSEEPPVLEAAVPE